MSTKLRLLTIAVPLAALFACSAPAESPPGRSPAPSPAPPDDIHAVPPRTPPDDGIVRDRAISRSADGDATIEIGVDGSFTLDPSSTREPGRWFRAAARDGVGMFYLSSKRVVDGRVVTREHGSDTWACDRRVASEIAPGEVALAYVGCRFDDAAGDVDAITGDFDVAMAFVIRDARGTTDFAAWVANRTDVGLDTFRFVFRVDPAALPARGEDTYALFGYDEWIQDPVTRLTPERVERAHPHVQTMGWGPELAGGDTGFYRNRLNTKPTVSIHTPDWGLLVQENDPANASPGWLMLGSNRGSLEFGYEYRLPNDAMPGNGHPGEWMPIGGGFRATPLPADRPVADQWWDAVEAYRPSLVASGLLPAQPLARASFPARWAQDCVYDAFNVGSGVSPVDVTTWAAYTRRLMRFHRDGVVNEETGEVIGGGHRNLCVLLWGWSLAGPYAPAPGVAELLAAMREIERSEGVQIHPMAYILATGVDYHNVIGTPLEDAINRDELGRPMVWGDGAPVDATHPAFIAEIDRTLDLAMDLGFQGIYFDNPFGEWHREYARHGGANRDLSIGLRSLLQRTADTLTENGGGVIAHEQTQAGLAGLQGAGGPWMGGTIVPYQDALWHDYQVTAFSGDLGPAIFGIFAADASADGMCGPTCEPGLPNNVLAVHRLVIDAAVQGRAVLNFPRFGTGPALWEATADERATNPAAALFYDYQAIAIPHALAARDRYRVLRTGRVLPPPPSDGGTVTWAMRTPSEIATGTHLHRQVVPRYATSFYQDTEAPGEFALAVGNAEHTDATVRFELTPSAYPEMTASSYDAVIEAPDGTVTTIATAVAGETMVLQVPVDALDLTVVTIRPTCCYPVSAD